MTPDHNDPKIFKESLGSFGTTTAPGENQLLALQAKIRQGVKHVELHLAGEGKGEFYKHDVPDKYGFEQRRTISQLAKLNQQTLSVHSTFSVNSFSGLAGNGFNEMQRNKNVKEIDESVKFASETAKGGAVVFHLHETAVPTNAGELNISERYLKFLKNSKNEKYKKEYERINSYFDKVALNPFEKQFQDDPNLEKEIKIRYERELKKNKNLKIELKKNNLNQNYIGYYEYLEKQKLELEQDGNPLVVIGESLSKAQRQADIIKLDNLKNLNEKEVKFLKEQNISLDYDKNENPNSTFNFTDFNRLKEVISTKELNGRKNEIGLTEDEFLILRKKISEDYYDVYRDLGRRKSTADKEFQQKFLSNQIEQLKLQKRDLDINKKKYDFYIPEIDALKKKEIELERDLNKAVQNGDKDEEFKIKEKLIGSDEDGKRLIKKYEDELYETELSLESRQNIQNLQNRNNNLAGEYENIQSSEELPQQEKQLQMEKIAKEHNENNEEIKKLSERKIRKNLTPEKLWDLKRRLDPQGGIRYLSRGGIKGQIDFLNYDAIGQTEFQYLERYDEQVAQTQEQIKKLEEQQEGLKVMTDEILDKNALSMSELGLNALNYQLDLYDKSTTSKVDNKKTEKKMGELEKKYNSSNNENEKIKLNEEMTKLRFKLRHTTGLSDYNDIVKINKDGSKQLSNPLYLAPENIMAGYGFMANLEEYKSAIRLSWQDFSEKILSDEPKYKKIKENYEKTLGKKITKENAFEIAKDHIAGTFDNAHAGTWLKYFKREKGETEDNRIKRFNIWLNDEAESMYKEGIIKHIHFNDTQAKDDDHNILGEGILDIEDMRQRLRKAGLKEALIVEAGGRGANENFHLLNAFNLFNPSVQNFNDDGYGVVNDNGGNVSDWITTKRDYEMRKEYSTYGMDYNSFKFEQPKNNNWKGNWSGSSLL